MTTSVTLTNLQTYCRNRGELRAPYITDTELTAMINGAIADIHRIILAHDKERLMTSELISVVSGTDEYTLNASFLQCCGVDLLMDTGTWVNCEKYDHGKRNAYQASGHRRFTAYRIYNNKIRLHPTPDWSEANGLRVWEVRSATQLSAGSDTWDSVDYWEEFVILKVCWMACAKSGEDPTIFASLLKDMEKDLRASVIQDTSEPGRVRDVYSEFATRPHHGIP